MADDKKKPLPAECCWRCHFAKPGDYYGRVLCRRYPPTPGDGLSFPEVRPGEWCGEFQLSKDEARKGEPVMAPPRKAKDMPKKHLFKTGL